MHTYQHACSQPGLGHGNRNGNARGVAGNESLQRQLQRQRRQWRPLDTCLSTLAHTHTCMHTSTHICNKWGELWLQLPLQAGRSCSLAFAVTERPIGVLAKMLSNNIYKHTHTYVHLCMCMCVLCQLACIEKLVECVVEKRPWRRSNNGLACQIYSIFIGDATFCPFFSSLPLCLSLPGLLCCKPSIELSTVCEVKAIYNWGVSSVEMTIAMRTNLIAQDIDRIFGRFQWNLLG